MRLIATKEDLIRLAIGVQSNYRTPRVTQLLAPAANNGGIIQRGRSFAAIRTSKPVIVVSIHAINQSTGLSDIDLLRSLVVRSSIVTFDTYTVSNAGNNEETDNSSSIQADPFNVYSYLYMTRGRLIFDLESYATSTVALDLFSALTTRVSLKIRTEVFSKDDNVASTNGLPQKVTNTVQHVTPRISSQPKPRISVSSDGRR